MPLDPTTVEVIKFGLSNLFAYLRSKGYTEDDMDKIFSETKAEFEKKTPDKLEDV